MTTKKLGLLLPNFFLAQGNLVSATEAPGEALTPAIEPPLILPNMENHCTGPVTFAFTSGVRVTTTPVDMDPAGEAYARICREWPRRFNNARRKRKAERKACKRADGLETKE
jgi:hypothetical protein